MKLSPLEYLRGFVLAARFAALAFVELLRSGDPLDDYDDDPLDDPAVDAYFRALGDGWTPADCHENGVQWCHGCPDRECYDNPNRSPMGGAVNPLPQSPKAPPLGGPFPFDTKARLYPALGTFWVNVDDPDLVVEIVSLGEKTVHAVEHAPRPFARVMTYPVDSWGSSWRLAAPWDVIRGGLKP